MTRVEFTGMLPAAIEKFEELMQAVSHLNPQAVRGYGCDAGRDSFFGWGAAAQITCDDMSQLRSDAESLGLTWLADDGSMAATNGLTIDDFKTYRVSGALELNSDAEGEV